MSKNATNRGPGRPAKTVNFPNVIFEVSDLKALNPGTCGLTIRKNVKAGLKAGTLVQMSSTVKTGKAGRPKQRFSTKESYDARLAKNLAKTNKVVASAPAPVAEPVTA